MMLSVISFILFLFLLLTLIVVWNKKKNNPISENEEKQLKILLDKNIPFYKRLKPARKGAFVERVKKFLRRTKISPVGEGFLISLSDKVYVAASAVIPIFNFDDWEYNHLDEVLLYPNTFTENFNFKDATASILGMVGEGALRRTMVLSLPALKHGFAERDGHNTGIHEFVHLIDMADGDADGIPLHLLTKDIYSPWMKYMKELLDEIRGDETNINPYAGKNQAEFFAVIAEYFFEKPEMLKEQHPEIFDLLTKMFSTNK